MERPNLGSVEEDENDLRNFIVDANDSRSARKSSKEIIIHDDPQAQEVQELFGVGLEDSNEINLNQIEEDRYSDDDGDSNTDSITEKTKLLRDFSNKNKKTKIIVKLIKKYHSPSSRGQTVSAEKQKNTMAYYHKKLEEWKTLTNNDEDAYLEWIGAPGTTRRKCIEPHSGFTTPFLVSMNNNVVNDSRRERKRFSELSSGFFPAFTMFDSSQLLFKCLFRFCKDRQWCTLTSPCSEQYPQYHTSPVPQTFDDIRFALHSFSISIILPQRTEYIPHGEVKAICSFFWCLPGDKLLLIISLLTVILLLVTALAFILFRRHTQFTQTHSNVTNDTSPNNTFYKPCLPQQSQGYYPISDDLRKKNNYTMCSCIDDCSHISTIPRLFCKENLDPDINPPNKCDTNLSRSAKDILKRNTNIPIVQKKRSELLLNPCDVSLFLDPESPTTCQANLESTEL